MSIERIKAGQRLLLFFWLAMILASLLFWRGEPLAMAFAWVVKPLLLWVVSFQGGGVMVAYKPVPFYYSVYSALLLAIPVVLIAMKVYLRFWADRKVASKVE